MRTTDCTKSLLKLSRNLVAEAIRTCFTNPMAALRFPSSFTLRLTMTWALATAALDYRRGIVATGSTECISRLRARGLALDQAMKLTGGSQYFLGNYRFREQREACGSGLALRLIGLQRTSDQTCRF